MDIEQVNAIVLACSVRSREGTVPDYSLTVFEEVLFYCKNNALWGEMLLVSEVGLIEFSESIFLLYCRGFSALQLKNAELFNVTFEEISAKFPNDYWTLDLAVQQKIKTQKLTLALHVLNEGMKKSLFTTAQSAELYLIKGNIYFLQRKYKHMFKALKTTLILNPDYKEAYKQMLWAVEYAGAYEDSVEFHDALLNQNPFNALAWMNLGYAYTALENYESALEAFGFVYAIDDQYYDAYMETGEILIHQKQFKRAILVFKQALALCGTTATGLQKLGYCYEQLRNFKSACQYYLQTISLDVTNPEPFYRMGVCALAENQCRLAIEFINKAIEIDSSNENYFLDLARAYKINNDLIHALRAYRFATELAPDLENVWLELILFLLASNQLRTAERVIAEALPNLATSELKILNIGVMYLLKQKKTALKLLRQLMAEEKTAQYLKLFSYFPALKDEKDIQEVIKVRNE